LRVIDSPQSEDLGILNARGGGNDRVGANCKHQFIIMNCNGFFSDLVENSDLFSVFMNCSDFLVDLYINVVASFETLRGHLQQDIPFLNNSSDVVGQSAVCVRNILAPLKNSNFNMFVESS